MAVSGNPGPTDRLPDPAAWRGRRVLLTGHTGFKGAWLARWLSLLGARVHGLALDPPAAPTLFALASVADVLARDHRVDLRDPAGVHAAVAAARPDVVLHLAAQPLVREGYRDPERTFDTNVSGTLHLLEAIHRVGDAGAIVVVTTDKVYLPRTDGGAHREDDRLGGHDPYAVSKAMVEDLVTTFRALPAIDARERWTTPVVTARAGNVIGGGDFAEDRLVPDCVRAFLDGAPVRLRYPDAVRPWQHVLDPLAGYLLLAESLLSGDALAPAYNLGPDAQDEAPVAEVARRVATAWGPDAAVEVVGAEGEPDETGILRLDSALVRRDLGWRPRWTLGTALERTVAWYRAVLVEGADAGAVTDAQLADYAPG